MRNRLFTGKFVMTLLLICLTIGAMWYLYQYSQRQKPVFAPSELRQSGGDTLDVAIEISPLTYCLEHDSLTGLDYALIQEYAKAAGRPLKLHPVNAPTDALEALDKGDLDMVISFLPSTTDMKEHFLLSEPIYTDRQVLVQRLPWHDTIPAIKDQLQLKGDTIVISKGSPLASRIQNLGEEIGGNIEVIEDPDHSAEQLFIEVVLGHIKLAVMNETVAKHIQADYPTIDISTPISFSQFQSWAVNKDNTGFVNSINAWLEQYKQTPEYYELVEQYLK